MNIREIDPTEYPSGLNADEWGDRLSFVLNARGLTDTAVAKALQVHSGTIGRWRKGALPSTESGLKLCRYLSVDPGWFLYGRAPH